MSTSNTFVVQPTEAHTHTVIFLHGRDSVASEFAEEFFESQASDERTILSIYPSIKWVFPESGSLSSQRFDTEMSQWFDIWSTEHPHDKEDITRAGIDAAIPRITDLIEKEAKLVSPSHILMGGISQGSAVAIHALLHSKLQIGGYLGFSTWLPFYEEFNTQITTPVYLAHNRDDEIISISHGEKMRDTLQQLKAEVTWREYEEGGHWFNEPQGVDDIVAFLAGCGVSSRIRSATASQSTG